MKDAEAVSRSDRPAAHVTDHLANERTYLAWVRTALGLIGIGFVLARMGVFLRQLTILSGSATHHEFRGGHEFLITGVFFLLLGATSCLVSGWYYPMFGVRPPEPTPHARENTLFSRLFARIGLRRPEKCSDNNHRDNPIFLRKSALNPR
jgi:uncharacterized membrane protein YidH (DUF202 family)